MSMIGKFQNKKQRIIKKNNLIIMKVEQKGGHVIDWNDQEKYLKTLTRENRKIERSRLKEISYRRILTSSLVLLKSTSSIKARFDKIIKGYDLWINQGKII